MQIKIITHEKVVFDGEADEIIAKAKDGEFGILPNHVPCMKVLDIGITKIKKAGQTQLFTVMGGIFQFKNDEALILTDIAESGNEIDVNRAKMALARAEEQLKDISAMDDAKRAEAAKARAMVRLKASMQE